VPEDSEELTQDPQEMLERVEAFLAEEKERKRQRLESLGNIVRKKIDQAVQYRKSSGIEKVWQEDEDFYVGADQYNKGLINYTKSRSQDGPLVSKEGDENRCTRFFNLTAQFVDAGAARMGDILLPAGDWNFAVKKTPVPESPLSEVLQAEDASTEDVPFSDGTTPTGFEDDLPVDEKVKKAETRIKDWLTEGKLHIEQRKAIHNAARIGTGILKGPFPAKRKTKRVEDGTLIIEEVIVPRSRSVDPINFFPDPNCGTDIQKGDYIVERSRMTAKQLNALIGVPGYEDDEIQKVIDEGPDARNYDSSSEYQTTAEDDKYDVWEYHGTIKATDADLVKNLETVEEAQDGETKRLVSVVLVVVNRRVIKGHTTPLDNREFPYDLLAWQPQQLSPFGIGISRQGRVGQEMVLAAARCLMDNMGLSSGVMLGMLDKAVYPADGSPELTKNKVFKIKESSGITDIKQAITAFEIPSRQAELLGIIELGRKMMEDATGVVFLLQGQQGSAPDTVGGMNLLHQNASSLLRRIARTFDENITEPHIGRYYDWLLVHGEDDEKGDVAIEAIGSSSLVKREIQALQAQQVLAMAENPEYGLSKKKAANEVLRAWEFEPSKFEMDKEEIEELRNRKPPEDPRIAAANIKAQTDMQIAQMKAQLESQLAQMKAQLETAKIADDTDRDTVHVQAQAQRDAQNQQYLIQKLMVERDLKMMDLALKQNVSLDSIKADLSKEAMKIQATKDLAAMSATADRLPKPPVEPPGRAPTGQSFTK